MQAWHTAGNRMKKKETKRRPYRFSVAALFAFCRDRFRDVPYKMRKTALLTDFPWSRATLNTNVQVVLFKMSTPSPSSPPSSPFFNHFLFIIACFPFRQKRLSSFPETKAERSQTFFFLSPYEDSIF